ncbi:metallophosphoesterase [Flavobacterium silvisoli]|uniref:Metallophosphoesterase n=1 Tax=Flavobacterium silvisoli TaxID=2529433 RepID=A0A4Q9Z3F9_9FLAO|nr:metallophosphoesterase [Flavobacterium silvisoli]TBX70964.1 metallophosphoesterase [Flavobacterium silvisoli]
MIRWVIFIVIVSVIEFYAFQAFKTVTKIRWVLYLYQLISLAVIVFIAYQFTQFDRSVGQTKTTLFTLGLLLLVLIPKLILTFFLLLEDVFRVVSGSVTYFMGDNNNGDFLPERRKFVSQIALGIASIPFMGLVYGMTKGKYNYKVIRQTLFFPDLPDAFDGFTITQISDVHSGSFDDPEKIEYAIDLVNQQKTDMMLFTGDIVNTHAKEMHPWIETFNKIDKHEYGKFSVLGNHDYGEYVSWPSQQAKDDNFQAIKDLYGQIGFQLLLNENVKIKKGNDEIVLVGVENWGHNFKQAGDINKASENLKPEDFKILMSHDPSHWEYEVKTHPKNFHLTLSGHTHGFQFGIEIPGIIKWSPVEYVYKQWAGLYKEFGRYVYVNRGFGFHAYPGRVGIWPEITVFELKKGNNVA